ncbi:hypothetical protein [Pseudobacteroides cellulosolvens]|uniref:TRAM domain-containing protein n=2 Tax=Pseudobacteroides cellulosolvens TaxID=35825 RepID=A0A0L6JST1_9FIRM|nr:hypothetical protein [Pseudobacteroides cellulosolvens]KNY28873.1 hypothetical protein Bccel_4147 [Pseudobacteroides cellulosolvens ATCC 35603 = DSM 2933]
MLIIGDLYTFDIIGLTQDGCGIGMVDGIKVFIEGVLPGETVRGTITKIEADYVAEQINSENVFIRVTAKRFIEVFKTTGAITGFDLGLYFKLVEKITVYNHSKLIISLLDGSEIE